MDALISVVQSKVAEPGDLQCLDCVSGTLVPDLSNGKYAFALVHCPAVGTQGLFVYRCQLPVKDSSDLTLSKVIAITSEFQYVIGTPTVDQSILQVKINSPDSALVIEVPFEPKSSNFFMNIKKCANVCIERMKQSIAPQFQWLDKYKAQLMAALGSPKDPFEPATFYETIPASTPAQTSQSSFGDAFVDLDPFADLASSRIPHRTSEYVSSADRNSELLTGGSDPALRNSNSANTLPAMSSQNSYVNCPKDPGFLVDFEGNILTRPAYVHPAPPKDDSSGSPWRQSDSLSDSNRISSSSSSSSESKTLGSLRGFEDDFSDIRVSTLKPTGTQYENASMASITTSSSTGSFESFTDQSSKSSTLIPEDDTDLAGYATIKPVFKPAGIRPEILKRREAEYTFPHNFRVFVGTWNVNGQTASEDLGPWLNVDEKQADIYAIGFQELDLSKEAFLFNDSVREDEWNKAIEKTLSRVGAYIQVKLIRLVGMMLLVFAKERHAPFIQNVIADTVGTGIMGKMGNKGGVAVRFDFHNTSFCFVNSHLAAHMEEFERRNQDYSDICSRMKFELASHRQPLSIRKGHEVIIWMGDLNYRISDLSVDVVKVHIDSGNFKGLMEYDQLYRQLRIEKVFKGFKEGAITFKPTYKYDPGTDNWDTSEKQRVPAWCDRILYLGSNIKQLVYRSHHKCKLSDHKPVSSLFDITVKVVDEKKFKQVVEEEIRKLDRQENDALPQVALSLNHLEFKDVRYMEPQTLTLDVANVGQVNTVAKFVNKLEDKHFCKDWLKVEPVEVFMMPADTMELSLTVQVDKNTAAALNSGEDTLEDILVFHLDNGKDYYITVSGNYTPSSFGASIEALVQMHGVIGEMSPEEIKKLEAGTRGEEARGADTFERFDIPKEIWMLVDHLFRNATKTENLFSEEGLHKDVLTIRDSLDIGMPEEMPGNVHSVAETLLMFLESLREPVIPYEYYNKCLECANNFTLCKQVLSQIPRSHRNVFKYLAAFIRELLMFSDENKLDTKTLATVFGEIFLRAPPSEREASLGRGRAHMQQISRKKATFVYQFIINEYDE
ncbi:inositol polyphosphate 5-phosphatase OCRL-like [Patiria miniata]|uniref:phosphoinositide 5-phosphatase n=1 Tax=Patiria miniata TaxID=46514 RepID=A0A914BPH5_PATMI|nr:inositol polyphosphate 5-phosphatase OCRL-like [Patiria miniata]